MDATLDKILNNEHTKEHGLTEKHMEEFRLYYVATSRCKFKLYNAAYISKEDSNTI